MLFKGNFLHARRDTVRLPDGHTATREYVVHPGAVVVVPLLDDGRVVLERQFRYPIGHVMIEFPAGKLDAGEDPLVCGQRELLEETGYSAREWAHAGAMHLAVAYSDRDHPRLLRARPRRWASASSTTASSWTCSPPRPEELLGWCRDGTVTDAKTLTCTLWLQNVLSGAWSLDWQPAPPIGRIIGA